jgi:hypothetical protein
LSAADGAGRYVAPYADVAHTMGSCGCGLARPRSFERPSPRDKPPMTTAAAGPRILSEMLALFTILAGVVSCSAPDARPKPSAEIAGRWVVLLPDGSSGDTLDLRPDGTVGGSSTLPASAKWGVKLGAFGRQELCAGDSTNAVCHPFRLNGATMEQDGGPRGTTTFRRVQ